MKNIKLLTALSAFSVLLNTASASISVGGFAENFDNDTTTGTNTIASFEVTEGNNRKLVVAITSEDADKTSVVTYGSQSFTKAVSTGTTRISEIWYLDDPTVGTADVSVSFSGDNNAARSRIGVVSLTGAAPGEPTASSFVLMTSTSASTLAVDFTTVEANTFVIGVYTQNNGGGNPLNPESMTNLLRGDSGSSNSAAGFLIQPNIGLSTYTWSTDVNQTIPVNGSGVPLNGLTIASFSPIPEPSTYALVLGGMAGLLLFVRRRKP